MRTPRRLAAVPAVLAVVGLVAAASPASATSDVQRGTRSLASVVRVNSVIDDSSPAGGIFGASSVWKSDISKAPVNPDSAALVANLVGQVKNNYGVAAFNVNSYGTSVYTVDADQKRIDVRWDNCQKKKSVPTGLLGEGGQFTAVPIPDNAVPAAGTDGQLTIYSPGSDQLWEFWKAKRVNGSWQACWGGRIDNVSTSPGYFSNYFGASASGLAVSGGAVGIKDVKSGAIKHALALQLVNAKHWATYSWPAQRSDGATVAADAIPEGLRFRLDPTVNVDALKLTPIARMVAKAAQQYGFIITDKAGAVAITAESGSAVQADTGTNPWPALMGGKKSYEIFANFPWDKMQALPMDYGKPVS